MRKILMGLFILLLSSTWATAGMNLRQNDDGSTDWVDASGNAFNVGTGYLTVRISDVSTAASEMVVVPFANGKVTRIDSVINGQVTGSNATFNFYTASGLTSANPGPATTNEISNGSAPLTIAAEDATGTTDSFTPTTQNAVGQGWPIHIRINGESTNAVSATLVFTIEPDGD